MAKLFTLPPKVAPDAAAALNAPVVFSTASATALNTVPIIGTLSNTPAALSKLSPTVANCLMVLVRPSVSLTNSLVSSRALISNGDCLRAPSLLSSPLLPLDPREPPPPPPPLFRAFRIACRVASVAAFFASTVPTPGMSMNTDAIYFFPGKMRI